MGLLSAADIAEIRAAIQDVTDTFMVSPIVYKQATESLDEWQEDREMTYIEHDLLGLVEYPEGKVVQDLDGANDFFDVMVSFNIEDLETLGLLTGDNTVPFVASKDRFIAKGKEYQTTFVGYDGPLEDKPVLYVIKGRLLQNPS